MNFRKVTSLIPLSILTAALLIEPLQGSAFAKCFLFFCIGGGGGGPHLPPVTAPEIDWAIAISCLMVVAGAIILMRERLRRRRSATVA